MTLPKCVNDMTNWSGLEIVNEHGDLLYFWIDPVLNQATSITVYIRIPELNLGQNQLSAIINPNLNQMHMNSFIDTFPWVALPSQANREWLWNTEGCNELNEECRVSMNPQYPESLKAIAKSSCMTEPYNGSKVSIEGEMTHEQGFYVLEFSAQTQTTHWEYCVSSITGQWQIKVGSVAIFTKETIASNCTMINDPLTTYKSSYFNTFDPSSLITIIVSSGDCGISELDIGSIRLVPVIAPMPIVEVRLIQ